MHLHGAENLEAAQRPGLFIYYKKAHAILTLAPNCRYLLGLQRAAARRSGWEC